MKKTTKYILIFFLVVIVGVCLIVLDMQRDEELLPEAKRLLALVSDKTENEAYLYLMGLDAAPEEDPVKVGRHRQNQNKMLLKNPEHEFQFYSGKGELPGLPGELSCKYRDYRNACLRKLLSKDIDIESIYKEHHIIIERVEHFFSYKEFKPVAYDSLASVSPAYHVINDYYNLIILKAISLHQNGDTQAAIDLIQRKILFARKKLAEDNDLLGKMVYISIIAKTLNRKSMLFGKGNVVFQRVSQLSLAEKNSELAFASQLEYRYNGYKSMFHAHVQDMGGGRMGKFLAKSLYKPNMTLNYSLPIFTKAIAQSKMSPQEFVEDIKKPIELDDSFQIRNYAGARYALVGLALEKYVVQIKNLDILISLFNHLHVDKKPAEAFVNPYYPEKTAFKKDGKVCFDRPFEDELVFMGLKCLLVSDNH